jgi:hypothetical protein
VVHGGRQVSREPLGSVKPMTPTSESQGGTARAWTLRQRVYVFWLFAVTGLAACLIGFLVGSVPLGFALFFLLGLAGDRFVAAHRCPRCKNRLPLSERSWFLSTVNVQLFGPRPPRWVRCPSCGEHVY